MVRAAGNGLFQRLNLRHSIQMTSAVGGSPRATRVYYIPGVSYRDRAT
jgi:hypothetical protein